MAGSGLIRGQASVATKARARRVDLVRRGLFLSINMKGYGVLRRSFLYSLDSDSHPT